MKTNKPKFHRATLEARILSLIEGAFSLMLEKQGGLDSARFNVVAFELWRDCDGGLFVNQPWRMAREVSLPEVLTAARGRWEVYKVNYEPRARVRDIHEPYDAGDYLVELHAGHAFLQIELVH